MKITPDKNISYSQWSVAPFGARQIAIDDTLLILISFVHDCFLVCLCNIPPLFHNWCSVSFFSLSVSIQALSTGVDQMKESASFFGNTLKVISCSFLNCLRAPVCTNISEDLSTSQKKFL